MGLINKLEEYKTKDLGLLKRADKIKESTGKVDSFHESNEMEMLLDELGDNTDFKKKTPYSAGSSESDNSFFDLNNFKDDISALKSDIENPIRLFKLLNKHLRIKKGAFLLLNPKDNIFIQHASINYDKTTQRRLRISLDENILQNNTFFYLEENEKSILKPYFSVREYSLIKNIIIINFAVNENILGILLISDSGLFTLSKDTIKNIAAEINPVTSSVLFESRKYLLNTSVRKQKNPEDNAKSLIESIIDQSERQHEDALFMQISFKETTEHIAAKLDNTDTYLIKSDLDNILNSMLNENAELIKIDENNSVLSFYGSNLPDEILLKHQINISIKKLFQELDSFPDLVNQIIIFHHNKSNRDDIISQIINENV